MHFPCNFIKLVYLMYANKTEAYWSGEPYGPLLRSVLQYMFQPLIPLA
jgi:hypothetical protein